MTTTLDRPAGTDRPHAPQRPAAGSRPAPPDGSRGPDPTGVRRTFGALLAVALAAFPLLQVFTDRGWLLDVWLAAIVTALPLLLLRLWWRPRLVQLFAGAALALVWLTARFLPEHAYGGVIPSGQTWQEVSVNLATLADTVHVRVAPLATTSELRLALAAGMAALVLLVDALAVVWRRPALAGLPLLIVFTVSGAVPRHAVNWLLFLPAAAGFLMLLAADSSDVVSRWGRVMPRATGQGDNRAGRVAGSARVIGVLALLAALLAPVALPGRSGNFLADALHNPSTDGSGLGPGPGVSLNPFVSLHGQLAREDTRTLFTVTVSGVGSTAPFYVRANVLDRFTGSAWVSSGHGSSERIGGANRFPTTLPQPGPTAPFRARFTIADLRDTPPVFAAPTSTAGLPGNAAWSLQDAIVTGAVIGTGSSYTESVAQPTPTPELLRRAPRATGSEYARWLQLPSDIPGSIKDLVARVTANTGDPYDAAEAILHYLSPANGFTYSLQTKDGDSGNDLVDFLLQTKTGYCQQYSASMATMLRMAGVPARIVLGYTHLPADASGSFPVTTNDAHAWVEAYFPSVGWVPFDPTPLTGPDAGRAVRLPYAPNGVQATDGGSEPTAHPAAPSASTPGASVAASASAPGSGSASGTATSRELRLALWTVLAVLLLTGLLAAPAAVRELRRRRRLRAADAGDADALWAELTATAADLGYVWSAARSPRQVGALLGDVVGEPARASLLTIAATVERARYAAPAARADGTGWARDLVTVEQALRQGRSARQRVLARLRPASLLARRRH